MGSMMNYDHCKTEQKLSFGLFTTRSSKVGLRGKGSNSVTGD